MRELVFYLASFPWQRANGFKFIGIFEQQEDRVSVEVKNGSQSVYVELSNETATAKSVSLDWLVASALSPTGQGSRRSRSSTMREITQVKVSLLQRLVHLQSSHRAAPRLVTWSSRTMWRRRSTQQIALRAPCLRGGRPACRAFRQYPWLHCNTGLKQITRSNKDTMDVSWVVESAYSARSRRKPKILQHTILKEFVVQYERLTMLATRRCKARLMQGRRT